MSYYDELIQVAAVAVAAAENALYGFTDNDSGSRLRTDSVLDEVADERQRQDAQWGTGRHHPPELWLTVLGEEYGEACRAALEQHIHPRLFPNGTPTKET